MSETKGYAVRDRRGGKDQEPKEACRVCGSSEVHTRDYNQPTMKCIEHLRDKCSELGVKAESSLSTAISALIQKWKNEIKAWTDASKSSHFTEDYCNRAAAYADTYREVVTRLKKVSKGTVADPNQPLRFRYGSNEDKADWAYGAYFPQTDLCVTDMGSRSTGKPNMEHIEWLDYDHHDNPGSTGGSKAGT